MPDTRFSKMGAFPDVIGYDSRDEEAGLNSFRQNGAQATSQFDGRLSS
jgi:hypothetical protein